MGMRAFLKVVTVLVCAVLVPTAAFAQASITGTVKDTSGAVLPGVTVEVASPALIEKVRSGVTDETGQYRIVDLRPGVYSVTFTLTGFSTFVRDGIELTGSFTATVNGDLRVGALEETITVSGETPIVDIQSVRRQTTVEGDTLKELPVARSYGSLFQLNPAVTTGAGTNTDIQVMPAMQVFGGPGGRNNEGRLQLDGLNVGAALNGGGVSSYVADVGNAQEVAFTTSGGLGEAEVGGPTVSIVPRTGGNEIRGSGYFATVTEGMVGSNFSEELRQAGLSRPGDLVNLWDYNFSIGGPIFKDKLWYYGNVRDEGAQRNVPGMFANANAGDPNARTYVADESRPARTAGSWTTYALRMTAQPTPRNRFSVFWDEQKPCLGGSFSPDTESCRTPESDYVISGAAGASAPSGNATSAPETGTFSGSQPGRPGAWQRVQQATWTSPMTSRLLLEAGFGTYMSRWGGQELPGNPTRDIVRVQEQCAPTCLTNGNIPNLTYRSQNWASNSMKAFSWRASASYVTGAHSMKFGYQALFHVDNQKNFTNNQQIMYRVNNVVPNQIWQTLVNNFEQRQRVRQDSFYAQEQWTRGRWTFQGALRYDHAWSWYPEQEITANRFLASPLLFPKQDGVTGYHDISPRGGVAWDVFGNGKTAVKVNMGKYLEAATNQGNYTAANPIARTAGTLQAGVANSIARSWTDSNNNFVPDCNLADNAAQNLTASGGDTCGPVSDQNFGTNRISGNFDPDLLGGWGVRPNDWQFGASIQQEILPRFSVEFGYFRRWLNHFTAVDNLVTDASDYREFSITAPSDPRLPNGGGYTISGLYNIRPELFGQTNDFTTRAETKGKWTQHYNGFLFNVSARPANGLTVQGGINLGKTDVDNCDVRRTVPELNPAIAGLPGIPAAPAQGINLTNPYCDYGTGFTKRATGLATYLIPKVDVSVSTTMRSEQGVQLQAIYNVPRAVVEAALGGPIAGNVANLPVNLVEPGTLYGDRINEIDLRFAKILRFGRTRTNVGFDIYNVLNADPILTYNNNFAPGGNWLVPTAVLTARFVKISAVIDF